VKNQRSDKTEIKTAEKLAESYKKVLTFCLNNGIISFVVSKKIIYPIWNAEVSELADEQD
jgi:hypothetical protein